MLLSPKASLVTVKDVTSLHDYDYFMNILIICDEDGIKIEDNDDSEPKCGAW